MKSKKLEKKLFFNRETIANLSVDKQSEIRGGATRLCTDAETCGFTMCPYTDCGDSFYIVCYC